MQSHVTFAPFVEVPRSALEARGLIVTASFHESCALSGKDQTGF